MNGAKPVGCEELRRLYESVFPQPHERQWHRSPQVENRVRLDRALTWLQRSEATADDEADERFLFYWISFNAAYGDDDVLRKSRNSDDPAPDEYARIRNFLNRVTKLDKWYRLADVIAHHNEDFRIIIDNRFLFNSFWKAEYEPELRNRWKTKFTNEQRRVYEVLNDKHLETAQTFDVLACTFDRLYTLRNQILHGSASWRDRYNRSSLDSGNTILGLLIPRILRLMLDVLKKDSRMQDWGSVSYPPYLETPDDLSKGPPR